jgi:hypothetical protein
MAWNTTSSVTGTNDVTQNQANNSGTQGTINNQNTYTQPQQGLQGQVPGLYSSLLAGQIPSTFTAPQPVIDNFNKEWQTWQAPQIAVNGGANSPMLAANQAMGKSNLLANLYNQGTQNYMTGLSGAETAAMTPTGQNQQSNAAANSNMANTTNQQYKQDTNQSYAAIQAILDLLQQMPAP